MTEIEILHNQLKRAKSLIYNDNATLDDIKNKGKMALENIFPTKYYKVDIQFIKFSQYYVTQMPESTYIKDWQDGQNKLISLLDTAIQDYNLHLERQANIPEEIIKEKIVYVQDNTALNEIKNEFKEYKKTQRNWIIFAMLTFTFSILIWLHFFYSGWNWYNAHSKKLGLTLLLNLTIIISLLNIPFKNKWLIWLPILSAVFIALFTII